MFVATFDDQFIRPDYLNHFIWNTTKFCDLHLISPAKYFRGNPKSTSKFNFQVINPNTLPQYRQVRQLFDDLFINYSTNSGALERACFHRWFALNAATTHLNDDDFICLLDSDFLIGMPPSKVLSLCQSKAENRKIKFIAEWANNSSIGPQITITTKSYLYGFCKYILTTFYSPSLKEQLLAVYFEQIGKGKPGGISDMKALSAYSKLNYENCFNLLNLDSYSIITQFNAFLNSETGRTKNWKISFKLDTQILHIENESKTLIGTHFQGNAKSFMHLAYIQNGEITREICAKFLASKKGSLQKILSTAIKGVNRFIALTLTLTHKAIRILRIDRY